MWTNVFLYKFDISQGYHHINTDDDYQKYLGFSWKIDGKIIYFLFIVLPFSFSSAPFIIIKVMRCLVKILEKVRYKKFACLLTTVLERNKTKFDLEGVNWYLVCPTILRPKDKQ